MDNRQRIIIVGAGLSGLATAHFLGEENREQILILEQSERPGGAIRSFREEGYRAEWGPHGFLDNNPESRELLDATGLADQAIKAPLGNNVRFVCHQGRLVALPQSPKALLTTPLLSLRGKLRLAGELFKKPLPDGHTIGEWAAHRFGPKILPLVDAAVTGTYAGDYQRLSIDAVMPGARRLEREYGSLLRGLLKERGRGEKTPGAQDRGNASGPPAAKRLPAMTSFPKGMEYLAERLSQDHRILYNCGVEEINHQPKAGGGDEGGWEVRCRQGRFYAQYLVLALPVNQALGLLSRFKPPVAAIPEARIATVALGFNRRQAQIPAGFGYLAPEREGRFTMGALFSSHMFPERAPADHHLLEALVGGRRHPERLELGDQELIERIYADLKELLPLSAPPDFARVLRSPGGIPQLEENHPRLLAWRERLRQEQPGLLLTGFGWDGIGMNDMMKAAKQCAKLIRRGQTQREEAALRPVYF
ncbi:MAG TPA: protoporphyrinogen oxidase [Desulfurivibrio alkaliphilus]|uniref:Coproporphyrinogen III oxidase n=1 Tax=Desulfurivibrio alkaliphilus TaxID=427923 RepID=A0A7C2TLN6_9BACT|nr:protoporphyrinogen oxidase [Desulfurivibrio alkaliphilus]